MDFPNHDVRLETERLVLRPFDDADFETAVPYYRDAEFLRLMEGNPPAEPVTAAYLRVAGEAMALQGWYFAIDHKVGRRAIGEVCLQWMNLERGQVAGERIVRSPIGIWDKRLWGRGYGSEVVRRLMRHAFNELAVDRFCAMDVKRDNVLSRALWTACGLRVVRRLQAGEILDFEITRAQYGPGGVPR
ncbi:MAG: GNAT family N-acetyltransferase [Gammaproteobacteria bacterium]|nr:GNAT family N-acetyltransferase [Gammaproteobacteria bacterium]